MYKNIKTEELDRIIYGRGPHIYAFTTETIPNYLKIGDTYRPVTKRLDEWRKFFPDLDKQFEDSAKIDGEDKYFRDKSVHHFLEDDRQMVYLTREDYERLGIRQDVYYSPEFFLNATKIDVADAIKDINEYYWAVRNDSVSRPKRYTYYNAQDRIPEYAGNLIEAKDDYAPRANQQKVIDNFVSAVNDGRKNLLMYAVMRFGKSFTSMCCAQAINARFVVIVSAKADVKDEWMRTILSHKELSWKTNPQKGYHFLTREELARNESSVNEIFNHGGRVVVFLTLQYLQEDNVFETIQRIFGQNIIDLLIVDETHYGARGEKLGAAIGEASLNSDNVSESDFSTDDPDSDDFVEIEDADRLVNVLNRNITLHLSGTPYRILLNNNEFKSEDIISFVQYTDIIHEQEKWDRDNIDDLVSGAKKAWDNPYYGFPQMIRFAFNLNESSRKMLQKLKEKGKSADLSTLLCPKSISKNEQNGNHKKFKHQKEVLDLLEVIDGSKNDDLLMNFLDYDGFKKGEMCRHVVMVLPYRACCDAMEELINANKNLFRNLCDYQIINIAGFECPDEYDTVEGVRLAIRGFEREDKKTLTLTVNRMLTGCTVEEWDTMIFLKGTKSPQEYDQASFRLQNTYVKDVIETADETIAGSIDAAENIPVKIRKNMKPQTLLVDFDPTRMFVMQERRAQIYNMYSETGGNEQLRKSIERDLQVSPIITVNADKELTRIEAVNVMEAVSHYNNDRGIKDEALDISVDLGILDNPDILNVIKNEGEIGARGSLKVNPVEPGSHAGNIDLGNDGNDKNIEGGEETTGTNIGDAGNGEEENDQTRYVKKVQNYYARILMYAFITDDEVISLREIIKSFAKPENQRIVRNLGLDEETIRLIYVYYYENNKAVLSELDYKIMDMNGLSHSDDPGFTPIEKADVALKKFGKLDDAIVATPAKICNDMMSMIPRDELVEMLKSDEGCKILDPASVVGEFAASFVGFVDGLPDEEKRAIPSDNVRNCFYAIPKSSVCYELTLKIYKMLGLNTDNVATINSFDLLDLTGMGIVSEEKKVDNATRTRFENARLKRVSELLTQKKKFSEVTLRDETEEGAERMNFDIVVSNPPYQLKDGGAQASSTPIYPYFFNAAKYFKPKYISMIMEARWYAGGKGLDSFRTEMLGDNHIRILHDYEKSADCFDGVEIKGGVCYVLWDKYRVGNCRIVSHRGNGTISEMTRAMKESDIDVFIRYNESISILNKVRGRNEASFSELVSSRNPFGMPTNFADFDSSFPVDGYVKVYFNSSHAYIKQERISIGTEYIGENSWKVYISKAYGAGDDFPHQIINEPFLGEPDSACTDTYIMIGAFRTENEARNVISYMKTKFFRFMVLIAKNTQDATKKVYRFVPMQDFSVSWTDDMLIKKYGLQKNEVDFINSMIRLMT